MVSNLGGKERWETWEWILDLWGVLCSWNWGEDWKWMLGEKPGETMYIQHHLCPFFSSEPCLAGEAGHWPLCSSDSVAGVLFEAGVSIKRTWKHDSSHSMIYGGTDLGQFPSASSVQLCGCRKVVQVASQPLNQLGDSSWNQQGPSWWLSSLPSWWCQRVVLL